MRPFLLSPLSPLTGPVQIDSSLSFPPFLPPSLDIPCTSPYIGNLVTRHDS